MYLTSINKNAFPTALRERRICEAAGRNPWLTKPLVFSQKFRAELRCCAASCLKREWAYPKHQKAPFAGLGPQKAPFGGTKILGVAPVLNPNQHRTSGVAALGTKPTEKESCKPRKGSFKEVLPLKKRELLGSGRFDQASSREAAAGILLELETVYRKSARCVAYTNPQVAWRLKSLR